MSFYCYAMVHFLYAKRCCCCCCCCVCAIGHGGKELHSFNAPHSLTHTQQQKANIHASYTSFGNGLALSDLFHPSLFVAPSLSLCTHFLFLFWWLFSYSLQVLNFCAAHLSSFLTKINVNKARASIYLCAWAWVWAWMWVLASTSSYGWLM